MLKAGAKPLKILMTADTVGGVWRYCFDLVAELVARHNVQVLLATMGPRASVEQKNEVKALRSVILEESEFALEWQPNAAATICEAGNWLLGLQSNFQPDLIHLNGYALAALPWKKPVLITAHSCVYSWWNAVHESEPGEEWASYKRLIREGLSACNMVVAPSRFMADELARIYDASAHQTRVIYNFSRSPWPAMQDKQMFCLAAGRMWDPAKNLHLLETIAPGIRWDVRVAGTDKAPDGSGFATQAVHYLGQMPHSKLLECMSQAGILLHPALYEPFGLVVLEAARASCALMLADTASLRELWDGAAIFVDPRDPDRWIAELNSLGADPQRRRTLGDRARLHAERYPTDESVNSYWDLYTSLVDGATRGRKDAVA